ncbi:Rrf2 family transcriptional regulator [Erwinia amylovora]|uniref:Rrf2 family transcriptional regulator n=1 Tax=Erwinia amylovora TaxID=552 RepID=UPI0014444D7A|nr:Rrf2 family transcriptional regulator [Erwinia amylovora]
MRVTLTDGKENIWFRDTEKREGMASLLYLKDGTQQKIIAALEGALAQARAEYLCSND